MNWISIVLMQIAPKINCRFLCSLLWRPNLVKIVFKMKGSTDLILVDHNNLFTYGAVQWAQLKPSVLSLNGCLHWKNQFDKRKQDGLVQKFGLRWLQRVDMIQAEPLFLLLSKKKQQKEALLAGCIPTCKNFNFTED